MVIQYTQSGEADLRRAFGELPGISVSTGISERCKAFFSFFGRMTTDNNHLIMDIGIKCGRNGVFGIMIKGDKILSNDFVRQSRTACSFKIMKDIPSSWKQASLCKCRPNGRQ